MTGLITPFSRPWSEPSPGSLESVIRFQHRLAQNVTCHPTSSVFFFLLPREFFAAREQMSEIDDIFSKRPSAKAPVASTSAIPPPKKKQKTKTTEKAPEKTASAPPSKKRPVPETIVDPSTRPPQKKPKVDKPPIAAAADKDDTERFKDSRGSGPRRKTEEGWSIYKEDELGIGNEGGDTPLCPFDCECCF
ncbi:hypothetical protein C8R45DRAFT_952136 [Mycena sanguinolenta]|nr:hypothetical protein C8R45DRAFT_952136 [Mycena sanguinolenta]